MIKKIHLLLLTILILSNQSTFSQNCNSKNGKLYLEDEKGNPLCPAIYDRIGHGTCEFKEGFAVVKKSEISKLNYLWTFYMYFFLHLK